MGWTGLVLESREQPWVEAVQFKSTSKERGERERERGEKKKNYLSIARHR
jgi:hypothetical protein